eukprot:TRINITY_DN7370_c0_g1_i1.p1 TRINITY_DN7370_c0_g1~~TRINITY_DN7370_c0_g1_i1.p1  ORF type:complete len:394 (+),score=98.74 TRINITY_DN7370_c0_g1_i1:118-1182(+)
MSVALFLRLPLADAVTPIELPTDATVDDLRAAVEAAGGPPPSRQLLLLGGVELTGHTALSDAGLCMEATVVVSRKRGRMRSVISTAIKHAVALLDDGSVVQWGECVGPLPEFRTDVVSVHAGLHLCTAILSDRSIVSWGASHESYLDGHRIVDVSQFPGLAKTTAAVTEDGHVLSDMQTQRRLGKIPPDFKGSTAAVSCGVSHVLGISTSGKAITYGVNTVGQLNIDFDGLGDREVIDVSAWKHSALLLSDGTVMCCGWDSRGQTAVPADVANVTAVRAAADATFALTEGGSVRAWGFVPGPLLELCASERFTAVSAAGVSFVGAVAGGSRIVSHGSVPLDDVPDLGGRRVAAA